MRGFIWILALIVMAGCANESQSWISIKNETTIPIYVLPYSSDFTNADWIQPGVSDDFYSISCDCLDGFKYFSFYYDSLIIHMEDHDDEPIKFYKDGTTVNYNPALNPLSMKMFGKSRILKELFPGQLSIPSRRSIFMNTTSA